VSEGLIQQLDVREFNSDSNSRGQEIQRSGNPEVRKSRGQEIQRTGNPEDRILAAC